MIHKRNDRPIIFVANSSWYLDHYRTELIKKCAEKNNVISISPIDKSIRNLSKISLHIAWNIKRGKSKNLIRFLIDLMRMLILLRVLKPKLIHSHTLKANLIISICSSICGIPCVMSFAGLGNLKKGKGDILLIFILRITYLVGTLERVGLFNFKKNNLRTKYIFQNQKDKLFFEKICNPIKSHISLISGSGLPEELITLKNKKTEKSKKTEATQSGNKINGCIYCGRLLRSKGVEIFINLSKIDNLRKYLIFGSIDEASSDSLKESEINKLKKIPNLKFKGFVKHPLLNFYQKNYVLLVPSIYGEGVPRAIAEALFLEIPIICTRNALSDIFTNHMLYVVDKRDPDSFLNVINKIEFEMNTTKFKKKKLYGKNFVLKNMRESKIVNDTLKIYKSFEIQKNKIYLNRNYLTYSNHWIAK